MCNVEVSPGDVVLGPALPDVRAEDTSASGENDVCSSVVGAKLASSPLVDSTGDGFVDVVDLLFCERLIQEMQHTVTHLLHIDDFIL